MQPALVVGTATSTVKHPTLKGWKLLLVQPWLPDGRTPDGEPLLVVDGVGAGCGDTVLITSDGRGARELLKSDKTPVRWTVIGICD
jgi:ethanolamine utilization protein EutN